MLMFMPNVEEAKKPGELLRVGDVLTVVISDTEIIEGKRGSGDDCAIALALKRMTDNPYWRVSAGWACNKYLGLGGPLPRDAQEFVDKYDRGGGWPFSFNVRLQQIGEAGCPPTYLQDQVDKLSYVSFPKFISNV